MDNFRKKVSLLRRLPLLIVLGFLHAAPSHATLVAELYAVSGCPDFEWLVVNPPSSPGFPTWMYFDGEVVEICREFEDVGGTHATNGWLVNGQHVPDDENGCLRIQVQGTVYVYSFPTPCGQTSLDPHMADVDENWHIELSEVLRLIQFYNSDGFHCDGTTEDGYAPGVGSTRCSTYTADNLHPDWRIDLSEVLRLIQFHNSRGYYYCLNSEDEYCPL